MSTFVLIHGAGDVAWSWHLVAAALRTKGHDVVAPDLPSEDDGKGLPEYADAVAEAVGDRRDLVIVGHSFGGFTAPLAAERLNADQLVLVTAMIPKPGEPPADWWANTGYRRAADKQAALDGGLTGNDDPYVCYYQDVPRELAEQAMARSRGQSETPMNAPWPLDAWPDVPTRFVLCTEDRFFPAAFMREVVADRLGVVPEEIAAGHCVSLSRPKELAALLG
ncbi:alpha/beta hydrolase [Actinocrispum sp. NPDC049592]|uniref:alpha/beta hydrolase n=1 Tax=Actinocrispum sp. NPDC049592 TaxID=3154835 RepID=UPI0034405BAF